MECERKRYPMNISRILNAGDELRKGLVNFQPQIAASYFFLEMLNLYIIDAILFSAKLLNIKLDAKLHRFILTKLFLSHIKLHAF